MATVLVTGGAGYIGSHTVRLLVEQGHTVTVIDNLDGGHRNAIHPDAAFIEANITSDLSSVFGEYDAVIHFAGKIIVSESVTKPDLYHKVNVEGSKNLMKYMKKHNCHNIIFSSSAAVYGQPEEVPIEETSSLQPVNPYGKNKLETEHHLQKSGLSYVALRYFNAAGASLDGSLGERHEPETHLIPLVLQATKENPLKVFGTDYNTKDGTCIRDYIHVDDLARAHILAMNYLLDGGTSCAINLGSGSGFSVREIIKAAESVTGTPISVVEAARREGDPAVLIADITKASQVLKWKPQYNLKTILRTAWEFSKKAL